MKFVCPRCQARLNIPAERVPEAGAWARCPKCRERFFLKVRVSDHLAEGPPEPGRPGGRTAEEQRLLERLRAKTGRPKAETSRDGPDGLGEVVVFPAPAPHYRLYGLAAALAVGGLLGVLLHAFQSAGVWPGGPAKPPPPPRRAVSYEERGLAADLAAMRRDFGRRPGLKRSISYPGPAARVFKYFMAQLAPEACGGEFSGLRLRSSNTRAGFMALGVCVDEGQAAPELEINWRGETALASLAGASLEINLRPARAGTDGAP